MYDKKTHKKAQPGILGYKESKSHLSQDPLHILKTDIFFIIAIFYVTRWSIKYN